MKVASLIVVLLAHHGLWFNGGENAVTLQWIASAAKGDATITWHLKVGEGELASGTTNWPAGANVATIKFDFPEVRAETRAQWTYRVTSSQGNAELAVGSVDVKIVPHVDWRVHAKHYADKHILVVDSTGELQKLLKDLPVDALSDADLLANQSQQEVIIVTSDQLTDTSSAARALLGQAEGGASVLIFAQPRCQRALQIPQSVRKPAAAYQFLDHHPLVDVFNHEQWQAIINDTKDGPRALDLSADDPVTSLVRFLPIDPHDRTERVAALLAVQSVGKGRVVYCTLPLTEFGADPAADLFLDSALDYLLSKPEATPPPSQKRDEPTPISAPTIHLEGAP